MKPLSHLQHRLLTEVFRNPHVHGYLLLQHGARSSVYDALKSLTTRGLVSRRTVTSTCAPCKSSYSITRKGRLVLYGANHQTEARLSQLRNTYLKTLTLR